MAEDMEGRHRKKYTTLAERERDESRIGKLSEIRNTLTETCTAIKELTNVVKQSTIASSPVDVATVNPDR